MATITVRFRGICCFIDPEKGGNGFKKRVVLPNGKNHEHAGMEEHLSIIEYYIDELSSTVPDGLKTESYSRPGDDAKYQRIELDKPMVVEFLNVVSTAKVDPGANLDGRLIRLDQLAPNVLRRNLLGPIQNVEGDYAKVVMDLPGGTLMAGPPEASRTRFPDVPKFGNRRVARWLELVLEVNGQFGLKMTPIGGQPSEAKEIYFEEGTGLITIANEPLRLITGRFVPKPKQGGGTMPSHTGMAGATTATAAKTPSTTATATMTSAPSTDTTSTPMPQATGHFDLYWDLMADPTSRPVPAISQGTGPGCGPANKP